MPLPAGTKLGPYEIQSPLGAGGMGEVYRATDTKLGRDIALKVLPADMAHDPERLARFRREAKALAQLDHPNIVTIHSVEEFDGVHFLTMQLVEGLPLDRVIPKGGLPVDQIVEIAGALGDALAAAHEKGIVHRDLKPANVMVSNDGRVKVLDFGLAKDVGRSSPGNATLTSDSRTQVGVVMGTPAYMSPEQTSGRPLDHRTDIFSLGVLLHEMATGRRPFEGTSAAELVSAILRDTPPSLTDVRPDLPSDLARIVRRCLEKDPRHRVQTARDVSNEFRDLARQTSQKLASATSSTSRAVADSGAARAAVLEDEGFWVAVLPFKYSGGNGDLTALAEGLTEDIVTGLSRFSYLRVIARNSTAKYSSESGDVRAVGKELGARYVMEGSLRQAGTKVRLAVQLVDATSGAHLWAETYVHPFNPEALFELQDDLVPRIVSTVAETHGVLPYSMSQTLRNRNPDELSPYEALLRGFAYFKHVNAADHAGARAALEKAVQQAPGNADCLAMLSMLYREEYNHGFNLRPDPLGRALAVARRAVDAAPSNHLAHHALASVLYLRRELQAFRSAAQRAMELNPMDGFTLAYMGFQISFSGEWERGCALMERARSLNPNHPGWYWFPPFFNAYRKGDYRDALELALKVNMPGFWRNELALAATYGQLGELDLARNAARELLAARPEFATAAREECRKWCDPDLVEQIIDGLRKAGLEIPDQDARPASAPAAITSGVHTASGASRAAVREDEGFWVAVLPFKYAGTTAELKALADGLTDDVVTGLSRFSYLRVVARSSTSHFANQSVDVRTAGKELGARYVMEGNLRQAGSKLRLAVQLVDAVSGAHLWAETYERDFSPEAVFALQDDLVPRIVSTVADTHGVLPRSMSEALRSRAPEQLSPYEAVLRSFGYWERVTPEDLAAALSGLESAVQKAPAYADAWAMLALLCVQEYGQGFHLQPDSLTRGLEAARRAVEAGPSNHLAYCSLAQALFFQKEFQSCRNAAERTVALNPMDGNSIAFLGEMLTYAGDWERGLELSGRAKQLNPNHPGWYWYADFYNAYRQGDYRGALAFACKFNLPSHWGAHALMVAVCGQLGERDAAGKALRDLIKLRPDFAATVREDLAKWWDPEYAERMIEGWRKAGLEIAPEEGAGTPTLDVSHSSRQNASGAVRADEGFWVAVLPFKYSGSNPELTGLAEGLTEDIVTGLSRFSYLRVIARSSTSRYTNQSVDVRSAGKELGARYVMEGSLRQAGSKLRLAVQLVDAVSGAHLWAENYERSFNPEAVFALQDDLVPRIVSTVADGYGVLPYSMSDVVRSKPLDQLTPYEALLRALGCGYRLTPEEYAVARTCLERAVQQAPGYADGWTMLSMLYADEYGLEFNAQPDPLGRALQAARRATDAAPSNSLAQTALAKTLFFRKEFQAFRIAAEQAISLNPMDGSKLAQLGGLLAYSGDWERGCALVERAIQLNPRHPAWYWFPLVYNAYRKGDYRGAVNLALKINLPGFFPTYEVLAMAYGQLGERDAASEALSEMLKLVPSFGKAARALKSKWFDPEMVEHVLDGLRKAGLEIADKAETSVAVKAPDSGATRTDEGFWVAVLPVKYAGTTTELKALADGLSEEIVTGLSRFSYLRVIARGSTAKYSSESGDVRSIGKELGARYVMEGSLRQVGTKLRLAVQLVDAVSGAHLWAETYERDFSPEAVFALQDDLVPRIVSTVADMNGVLPRSMSEAVRSRPPEQLSPYEAVLRGFGYMGRITPEDMAAARPALELVVRKAPGYADAWAMLALLCVHDYAQGFNLQPDSLTSALVAARRAVEIGPSNPLAYWSLAQALFFHKEFESFRNAAERAVALNPMDGNSIASLGAMMVYAGGSERGLALAGRAKQLNPNHPGWYWFVDFYHAYRQRDYRGALNFTLKVNLPGHWASHVMTAAACGQLGEQDAAAKAIRDLLNLRPNFAATARKDFEKWWQPEYVGPLMEGLRKAGLEIPEKEAGAPATVPARSSSTDPGALRVEEVSSPAPSVSGNKRRIIPWAVGASLLVIVAAGIGIYLKSPKAGGIDSIAVLPLENRSSDPGAEYISDGITESINNSLARLPSLKVTPHSVASHYKGKATDVRKVGDELGVQAVLAGSVAQRGDDLTVDVELDDVRNGKQLWGEQYHRKLADLLAVQSDIAREVSQRLRSQLSVEAQKDLTKGSTANPAAYRLYLKGKYYTYKLTKEGFDTGIDYYNQAIAIDPNYALAYSGLAFNYINQEDWHLPPIEGVPKAKDAAKRALAIDDSDAGAHLVLAIAAYWYDWDWAAAESEFKRSLELNPNSSDAYWYYGWFLASMRRNDQAIAEVKRSQQIDPLTVFPTAGVGTLYLFTRQWDPAIEQLRHAIAIDPSFWFSYSFLGRAYEQKGRLPEAIAQFQRALELEKENAEIWSGLGNAYAVSGNRVEAQKVLDHLKELSAHTWVAPYNVAVIYAGLGEKDQAFALLERAYQDRSYYMPSFLTMDERLDKLHSDPRFADLVRRVGLPK